MVYYYVFKHHHHLYRRQLDALGVLQVLAADITIAASRLWLHVQAGYFWLRFRHDGLVDEWETDEDRYCQRYWADPEIFALIDEYLDCVFGGLAGVLNDHLEVEDALPPAYYEVCMRMERAIAERIWQEDGKLDRTMIADRRWVREAAQERAGELASRMFWSPPTIDFDELDEE
jgi:hypothetical protein